MACMRLSRSLSRKIKANSLSWLELNSVEFPYDSGASIPRKLDFAIIILMRFQSQFFAKKICQIIWPLAFFRGKYKYKTMFDDNMYFAALEMAGKHHHILLLLKKYWYRNLKVFWICFNDKYIYIELMTQQKRFLTRNALMLILLTLFCDKGA